MKVLSLSDWLQLGEPLQPHWKPCLHVCFRVPTATEVEKWKESFSHMMSSESKCSISASHMKKKKKRKKNVQPQPERGAQFNVRIQKNFVWL